jgi:hypothetical protein
MMILSGGDQANGLVPVHFGERMRLRMPHYHFRLTSGAETLDDAEGLELPGEAAAREEAARVGKLLLGRQALRGQDWSGWFVAISDASGKEIDRIPLAALETD